jgi:hypothetical protein
MTNRAFGNYLTPAAGWTICTLFWFACFAIFEEFWPKSPKRVIFNIDLQKGVNPDYKMENKDIT